MRVLDNGVLLAEYAYNGFGERIKKVTYNGDATKISYYLYDGSKLTTQIEADSDTPMRHGVFIGEASVAYLIGRDVYALHSDHVGTPRLATNAQGETVWSADYAPFGQATITEERIDIPYRFAGQYFDAETGTHYNYYRDYDPATGRYITSDPIGLQGGFNTYAYALNNPLGLTDPLGLNPGETTGEDGTGESPDKPYADSEQAYTDKLTEVFKYAHEKLKNTDGAEIAAQFMDSLIANAAVVAAIVVGVAAANAAGFGLVATGILAGAGWVFGWLGGRQISDIDNRACAGPEKHRLV